MTAPKGSLMMVLHAHMPYVRRPDHEYFIEENWLYEAVLETYVPLVGMLGRLAGGGGGPCVSVSLSPTLLEMLSDPLLVSRTRRHMQRLSALLDLEVRRRERDASIGPVAVMYRDRLAATMRRYEESLGADLPGAFRRLAGSGRIEFFTTSATHALLPLLAPYPREVRAQVRVGIETFRRHMGLAPAGLWLPECGYYEGLDEILKEEGAGYFIVEEHGLLHARPRPMHASFMPVRCPSGVVAFGRDSRTSSRVWDQHSGYPGHPDYRDFYEDAGFGLSQEDIRDHVHPDGLRTFTGIKYWSITGGKGPKKPYFRELALQRAYEDAEDFVRRLEILSASIHERYGFSPLFVAAFDAELFGHWWFEGVEWLERVLELLDRSPTVRAVTPSSFLAESPVLQFASPSTSSWADGGYFDAWTCRANDWAVRHIHKACGRMEELLRKTAARTGPLGEALRQARRELLLAQSSDWGFLMRKGSHSSYARKRLVEHLEGFNGLADEILKGKVPIALAERLGNINQIFAGLDPAGYSRSLL